MNVSRSMRDNRAWVFRGIFLRALVAGVIGGVIYAFLSLGLSVAGVEIKDSGLERALYHQLILSILGAFFGLIYGGIFGFIDGIALSLLMSTRRFTPDRNQFQLSFLSLSSAAITGIGVILILNPLDIGSNQPVSPDLVLIAIIAAKNWRSRHDSFHFTNFLKSAWLYADEL